MWCDQHDMTGWAVVALVGRSLIHDGVGRHLLVMTLEGLMVDTSFKSRVSAQADAYTLLMARLSAPVEPRKAAAAARRARGIKAPAEKPVRAVREPRKYAAWDDDSRRRSVRDAGDVDPHTLELCVSVRADGSSCGAESHVVASNGGV